MESLVNYGSDDEQDSNDLGNKPMEASHIYDKKTNKKPQDDNYETVGMDLSEESSPGNDNDNFNPPTTYKDSSSSKRSKKNDDYSENDHHKEDRDRNRPKDRHKDRDSRDYREGRDNRESRDSRESRNNRDGRDSNRDGRDSRDSRDNRDTRESRDSRDTRDSRDSRDNRESRDNRDSRDRDRDKRKDYRSKRDYRDRRERDDYRDRDREYRSRSSRNYGNETSESRDRHRRSSSPKDKRERKTYNARSESRERNASSVRATNESALSNKPRDYENKTINKLSPSHSPTTSKESKSPPPENKTEPSVALPTYYNPKVINPNKYAERLQKRKLLWSNKKPEDTTAKWGNAKFAQDTDGKVASKFMRLMGIKSVPKSDEESTATAGGNSSESIQKQEEMFTSMEQQYEVARQVTHTMRGVGLGFGSQARQF